MAAKELQENRLTRDARDREVVAVLIWSRKASQALAYPDRIVGNPLWADVHEDAEEDACRYGDSGGNAAEPACALSQGKYAKHRPTEPTCDETRAILGDLHVFDSLAPQGHRSSDEEKGDNTEGDSSHEPDTRPETMRPSSAINQA